jgi:hypothetical protein
MKTTIVTLLAAAAGIVVAQLPATAQNRVSSEDEGSQRQQQLAPAIGHVAVRATLLHWGMPQADIARVMGAPSQVAAADDEGTVRVLKYSAEPIATTVTITDGKLSGVALDVAGVDDPALPNFARVAWLGMNRTTVLGRLGMPAENHLRDFDGMNVEQMIFERPREPDVSIFLIDGRVAAKKVGRSFPTDILGFALPLASTPATSSATPESLPSVMVTVVAIGSAEYLRTRTVPSSSAASTCEGAPMARAISAGDMPQWSSVARTRTWATRDASSCWRCEVSSSDDTRFCAVAESCNGDACRSRQKDDNSAFHAFLLLLSGRL